jgi:glycine oxidase ThiO
VVVVGGGLIGLACGRAVAQRGLRVLVISSSEPGAASPASAGILAPSVGVPPEAARTLGIAARDMYPAYVQALASRTGIRVPLDRSGVLEVVFTDDEATSLRARLGEGADWIGAKALHRFEPSLAPAAGAALHPGDGAVDSAELLNALRADAWQDRRVALRDGRVIRVDADRTLIRVELATGDCFGAPAVVIAAGAWVSSIAGLPRPLPIVPVRGQMLAFTPAPLRHVIMGPRGYIVPRGNQSLVGSTMEEVGFDASTTAHGAALLHQIAGELSPALGARPMQEHWAGLRPVTPDLLPIVGPDPDCKGLFYACGHSKNGVLLAPLTAQVIADLISNGRTAIDAAAYRPGRFRAIDR